MLMKIDASGKLSNGLRNFAQYLSEPRKNVRIIYFGGSEIFYASTATLAR